MKGIDINLDQDKTGYGLTEIRTKSDAFVNVAAICPDDDKPDYVKTFPFKKPKHKTLNECCFNVNAFSHSWQVDSEIQVIREKGHTKNSLR